MVDLQIVLGEKVIQLNLRIVLNLQDLVNRVIEHDY